MYMQLCIGGMCTTLKNIHVHVIMEPVMVGWVNSCVVGSKIDHRQMVLVYMGVAIREES